MQLTDTHTHPYTAEFDADRDAVMRRAIADGVTRMIMPNINVDTISPMHELAARYPENVRMALGLHPEDVRDDWRQQLAKIENQFSVYKDYVAIGEIGLDFYWDATYKKEQLDALEKQLEFAEKVNLPVILHCRKALDELLEVLQGHRNVGGVMHCFGGTEADVERARRVGDYYFGIGGIITFKNSSVRQTLPAIGKERIVLETDAPYLAPVPHRGRRNESAYIVATAATVGQTLQLPTEEIAAVTAENSRKLFGF